MDSISLQKKIEEGIKYFSENKYENAIQEFEELLKLNPFQVDSLHWMGCISFARGDFQNALNYLMESLIRLSDQVAAQNKEFKSMLLTNIGRVYQLSGNLLYAKMLYVKNSSINENAAKWNNEIKNFGEEELEKAEKQFQFTLVESLLTRGLVEPAKRIIEELLLLEPNNNNYKHYYAVALHLNKETIVAEKIMQETVVNDPENNSFKINYANVLKIMGKLDKAKELLDEVLKKEPSNSDALNNRGNVSLAQKDYITAKEYYEEALKINPKIHQVIINLGTIAIHNSRWNEAEQLYKNALEMNPNDLVALNNLSVIYKELGKIEDAVHICNKVLEIDVKNAEAWTNLGNNYRLLAKMREAERAYEKAYEINPNDAIVVSNYGNFFGDTNDVNKALSLLLDSIKIDPGLYASWNNLGAVYLRTGRVKEAAESFLKSYELNNENYGAISNYLLSLNYLDTYSQIEIKNIHEKWSEKLFANRKKVDKKQSDLKINDVIKIGFVSSDFRRHSVALFLKCIYENIDRSKFKIYSYSGATATDEYTDFFRKKSFGWFETYGIGDLQVANVIANDDIDILFDVGGFTNNNRLGIFAYKPANIQATWMGYVATTGLKEMDFRLVDWNTDPLYTPHENNTEKLIRLSRILQSYAPTENAKLENPILNINNDEIVFGCFNNFAKISAKVLSIWGELLSADKKKFILYLKSVGVESEDVKNYVRSILVNNGADSNQVRFGGQMKDSEHLKEFSKVHIALDPFPFNGATTTFETLYMGVPVVALEGNSTISRLSSSILKNLDMSDWVAKNTDDYIKIAINKSNDINGLLKIRANLRNKMNSSVVLDGKGFVRDFESAIYQMIQIKYGDQNECLYK